MMASTPASPRCAPCLSAMPPEILQEILWHSLELNLCLTSKQIYNALPKYQRLARFLPLLAFGPGPLIDKIIDNAGDNCSDVVKQLAILTPLSKEDRLMLQQRIMDCGWFEVSSFVEAAHAVEEYAVQHFWIDPGIKTQPRYLHHFTNRHVRKAALRLVGKDEHGGYHLLDMRRDVLDVAHYKEEDSEELYSLREIDDELGHLNYSIPLLVLHYIPNKLLETPLPQASSNLDPKKGERLTRPMPDFLRFLWERSSIYPVIPQDYYMISATAIDHAICEAISTSNHYFLDAIFALPLSADGETKLQPVTAGHFIAAAQLLDAKAIELLWQKGYSHFEKEWLFL